MYGVYDVFLYELVIYWSVIEIYKKLLELEKYKVVVLLVVF